MAQAFVDYMATQGVILTIQQHNQSDVWLADESQAERVRAELARFLENPADPRYLAASWQAAIPAVVCIIAVILSLLPCVNAQVR